MLGCSGIGFVRPFSPIPRAMTPTAIGFVRPIFRRFLARRSAPSAPAIGFVRPIFCRRPARRSNRIVKERWGARLLHLPKVFARASGFSGFWKSSLWSGWVASNIWFIWLAVANQLSPPARLFTADATPSWNSRRAGQQPEAPKGRWAIARGANPWEPEANGFFVRGVPKGRRKPKRGTSFGHASGPRRTAGATPCKSRGWRPWLLPTAPSGLKSGLLDGLARGFHRRRSSAG